MWWAWAAGDPDTVPRERIRGVDGGNLRGTGDLRRPEGRGLREEAAGGARGDPEESRGRRGDGAAGEPEGLRGQGTAVCGAGEGSGAPHALGGATKSGGTPWRRRTLLSGGDGGLNDPAPFKTPLSPPKPSANRRPRAPRAPPIAAGGRGHGWRSSPPSRQSEGAPGAFKPATQKEKPRDGQQNRPIEERGGGCCAAGLHACTVAVGGVMYWGGQGRSPGSHWDTLGSFWRHAGAYWTGPGDPLGWPLCPTGVYCAGSGTHWAGSRHPLGPIGRTLVTHWDTLGSFWGHAGTCWAGSHVPLGHTLQGLGPTGEAPGTHWGHWGTVVLPLQQALGPWSMPLRTCPRATDRGAAAPCRQRPKPLGCCPNPAPQPCLRTLACPLLCREGDGARFLCMVPPSAAGTPGGANRAARKPGEANPSACAVGEAALLTQGPATLTSLEMEPCDFTPPSMVFPPPCHPVCADPNGAEAQAWLQTLSPFPELAAACPPPPPPCPSLQQAMSWAGPSPPNRALGVIQNTDFFVSLFLGQ